MADIDDDLLDLAGGDSGDEGSVSESRGRSESPRPSKKSKRSGRQDDSDEDGEANSDPGTPNSLESAPMDESDSEDEPQRGRGGDTDGDGKYPVEGMYISHAEKAEIMALPELEREQIIADRMTEIDRQRQNRLLRQMVENEERKHVKKKRSADTAELEDAASRKTSRQRTVGGKGETAMDSLRRARAEKQKRREDAEQRRRGGSYSPDGRRSPDDNESDVGGRDDSRTPEAEGERKTPPAELRDYDRVRLGRNEFAQVCLTPGFEASITGCYIRIALGPHPETGIEQYRMAVIKGFTTGKPYALNGPNGSFITDQYARAAHGKAVKEFPFIAASSGKFTESELNRYTVACHNEGVTLPTKAYLSDKIDDINGLINHRWTNEEIKARLARKNELRKRFDPAERERVARLLEEAREAGDDARMEELQEQLDKMGSQRLAFRTSLSQPNKSSGSGTDAAVKRQSEQDRLAERNRENRRLNAEAVRKAQLKERARSRGIEKAIQRGELVEDDPSRRVKTKAKFIHDINDPIPGSEKKSADGDSGASTPANGTPKAITKSMPAHLAKLHLEKHSENKGLPTVHKPLMDDDIIGALDLDIDVEI
ncbi:hypothetical protein GMORB2_0918 [Geosmithia morbida]|uniref:Plus3 domain-containing protein n=1 Tax=Geosmithia morbida TaxID=1094350 RepID=A0A9P5D8M5_9HYPO|nr:uncharacterized protein GMORB2_0918 [Geosmithia morbida]KAF4125674.1 hypothetical protein GMORB2_0918 [Geosmithia morbida]